jgi:OmpA-OmpF porin, OOP family
MPAGNTDKDVYVAMTRICWRLPACLILIASLGAPSACLADDVVVPGNNYFSALAGYLFAPKDLDTTGSGATLSALYGHQFARHFSVEGNVEYSTFEAGVNNGTNFYQTGGTVDVVYSIFDRRSDPWVTPFVLLGAGGADDDWHPDNRGPVFLAELGGGAVTKPLFSDAIRFRFDARWVHDSKDGGHSEPRALLGIEIPLGRTLRHVEYLPGKTEIREVIKEREVAVPVAPPRSMIDSDGDGVPDDLDECPNTPRGMKVDARGCIINQTFALAGVTFDFNQARLTPNAQTVLDTVSLAFLGQPTLRVEIAGHTDSIGSQEANLMLSQKRADSVRAYLITKGVRSNQLEAHGYGKSQLLIDPERGDADRERNRRVELRVEAQ